jgi:transcriptional regulator with XRE-family HTH domain
MNYRPEYDMKVMGRNLRRLREKNNLTVEEVKEYLRLGSVQAVYKYESGRGYPQVDAMFALMELYGADMYEITRNYEEDEKSSSVILGEIIPIKLNYMLNDFYAV